ncbi:MAG: hypothetical protein KME05_02390 [Gloeocapsa sp. UFS-A4-WI-NPMV-4B04]|jgi:hypothetical protein|nr:hypothetical protein [Gloeocapsa sp. UFS-A4-WI-NPMV-4B04]
MLANFHNNAQLIDWVNEQPLAQPVVCLGDGHDGIWNTADCSFTRDSNSSVQTSCGNA